MISKKIFKKPFEYKEAFIFVAIFPILGFIIELFSPTQVTIPKAPINIYILLALVILIIFTHLILTKYYFFRWLSSVPVSVSTIFYVTFLVLIMALVPQNEDAVTGLAKKLGFDNVAKSWAMITTSIFLLYALGLVVLNRLKTFTVKDIVFFLNHLGLWIVIAAASLGSGDLIRLNMYVWENSQPEWKAISNDKTIYDLPIAVKLINFEIDEFNPEIALINNADGTVVIDKENKIQMIELGEKYKLNDMTIEIQEYFELAMNVEGNYVKYLNDGASPAVKIAVYNNKNELIHNGWISAGSHLVNPQTLLLNNKFSIGLLQASPKKYSSEVELFAKDGTREKAKIEVNKPYSFKGWKIYQISYDEEKGRWSELSVLEFVRDPWIPIVYIGIFMVLVGSIYLFWIGKKEKQ